MSSCPYSDEELQKWDSVCNPMGEACYECNERDCDHWAGTYDDADFWDEDFEEYDFDDED